MHRVTIQLNGVYPARTDVWEETIATLRRVMKITTTDPQRMRVRGTCLSIEDILRALAHQFHMEVKDAIDGILITVTFNPQQKTPR